MQNLNRNQNQLPLTLSYNLMILPAFVSALEFFKFLIYTCERNVVSETAAESCFGFYYNLQSLRAEARLGTIANCRRLFQRPALLAANFVGCCFHFRICNALIFVLILCPKNWSQLLFLLNQK